MVKKKKKVSPVIIKLCKDMLLAWIDAPGIYSESEGRERYASDGRKDVAEALKAIEEGRYESATPITANLWDAGYGYDDTRKGYSLGDLGFIKGLLSEKTSLKEFEKARNKTIPYRKLVT